MNIFDLKQERAEVTKAIRDMMDKYDGKEMDGADKDTLGNLEARFDSLNDSILAEEKQIEREKLVNGSVEKKAPLKDERMQMFANALTGKAEDIARFKNDVNYTLGTNATAGYLTAPMEFRDELIKELDNLLFMRTLARNIGTIGASQSLGFPYRATAAADAQWVSEVAAAPEEQALAYGQREFKPNRMAKLIKLSKTLVSHSDMAERVVKEEMAYRIAVTQENAYMTGNGSGKPLGIFTASNDGIPTTRDVSTDNGTTYVTADGLLNAKYTLKQQYLANASWVMHRDIVKQIAKLKDSDNNYLWIPSMRDGQPDTLLGHPVFMSEYAPNTSTTGQYVAVFGDFNYYWIVDADALEVQILNELYAVTNQVGYLYNYFGDGAPVLGEAFVRVKLT